jgi:hypothetical protein
MTFVTLVLASCSPGGESPGGETPTEAPFDASVSPLTGLKVEAQPDNPVYYVKIENTQGGAPQYGENKADMMIEELVEGGATRLIGLFHSELPTRVGHVRSARTTDIAISEPVGATIVASGAAKKTIGDIEDAGIEFYTYDKDSPGWSADPGKVAPYHVLWNLQTLNETASSTGKKPERSFFAFGDGPASADVAKKVTSARVQFSPASTTNWTLSDGKWHRANELAASGEEYAADTVVVIFARVVDAGYNDAAGNPVPETVVEGSGRAVIFTGGDATEATWTKSESDATMTFTSKGGQDFGLKPGHIWLEVVPRGGAVTY